MKHFEIRQFESLPSTNETLKTLAAQGAADGTVVTALRQTAGKGTRGRSFFSPAGGLYFSVLLRRPAREDLLLLTPLAAVAAARACEDICGVPVGIKWVNDLYLDGKKISGTLTETTFGADGAPAFTVIGTGINLAPPEGGFPDELRDRAGTLPGAPDRGKLLERCLFYLEKYLSELSDRTFLPEYRQRMILTGKTVTATVAGKQMTGIAEGVGDDCSLILRLSDGSVCPLRDIDILINDMI